MNLSIEKEIVSQFIVERKKERILYELSNSKKRQHCIWLLDTYFRRNCVEKIDKHEASYEQIYALMKGGLKNKNDLCYIMSVNNDIDAVECSLREALEKSIYYGVTLVYCVESKLAYWEGENEGSDTNRWILLPESMKCLKQ